MHIKPQRWHFTNEAAWRNDAPNWQHKVILHCRKPDYDAFILASLETTNKLIKEPEVVGLSSKPTWKEPFNTYVVAIQSEKGCERLIEKYPEIQGFYQN